MYKYLPEREARFAINTALTELKQKNSAWKKELDDEKRNDAVNNYIKEKSEL